MKKMIAVFGVSFLVIILVFVSFTIYIFNRDVPVLNADGVSDNYLENIKSQAGHMYSGKLPLVTWYINIDEHQENQIDYTIYYWPFGSVKMTYLDGDGFSMEKKLIT